jgi:acyl-CoA thioester hydrolase
MLQTANSRRLEVQMPLEVKGYDIDVVGIVSNIVYVRWLEDLRMAMLTAHLPLKEQMDAGIVPAILKTQVEYKHAVVMHDNVLGRIWLSGLSKMRWVIGAEFLVNGQLAAQAEQEGCFISLKTKRPVRLPAKLTAMWEEFEAVTSAS